MSHPLRSGTVYFINSTFIILHQSTNLNSESFVVNTGITDYGAAHVTVFPPS